jgi:hypothetical protein
MQELKATALTGIREAKAHLAGQHAVLGQPLETARALFLARLALGNAGWLTSSLRAL